MEIDLIVNWLLFSVCVGGDLRRDRMGRGASGFKAFATPTLRCCDTNGN